MYLSHNEGILVFDDQCMLCNKVVLYIARHDKHNRIKFSFLTSNYTTALLKSMKYDSMGDSVIFIYNEKIYQKTNAVLMVLKTLGGFGLLVFIMKITPRCISDYIYDRVAKYRYKLFGKTTCNVDAEVLRHKILI